MPGRGGETASTTFNFKADGEKLTNTMTGPQGEIPLQEGKVAGNQLSFSTTLDFGGNSVKIVYKGTLTGDQIKLSREREGSGQPREFTCSCGSSSPISRKNCTSMFSTWASANGSCTPVISAPIW